MKINSFWLASTSLWAIVFAVVLSLDGKLGPASIVSVAIAVVTALLTIAAELHGIASVLANQKKGSE